MAENKEQSLYKDLKKHIYGKKIERKTVEKLACIPDFIKMTLLSDGDEGISVYERKTRPVSYESLRYEIIEAFIQKCDFESKQEWEEALLAEIKEIDNSDLFSERVFACFLDALKDMYYALTPENIREMRRIMKECR